MRLRSGRPRGLLRLKSKIALATARPEVGNACEGIIIRGCHFAGLNRDSNRICTGLVHETYKGFGRERDRIGGA